MSTTTQSDVLTPFLAQSNLHLNPHPIKGRTLNATTPIPRGTLVLSPPAFATVAVDSPTPFCHYCLTTFDPHSTSTTQKQPRCSACQRAKYCNETCQKQDWKTGHKYLCNTWKRREAGGSSSNLEWEVEKDEEMLLKVL
ncbi:hypothetical protein HK097_003386, partial [Rhizophlyctis rosea]